VQRQEAAISKLALLLTERAGSPAGARTLHFRTTGV
jgi:hypothetical protein